MVQSIYKSEEVSAAHPTGAPPDTALLSNGRYSVLLTEAGSGYGSWRGLDVTRWREDGTRDCWGQFCYIRDIADDKVWTIGRQPICRKDATYEHGFRGDRAEFAVRSGTSTFAGRFASQRTAMPKCVCCGCRTRQRRRKSLS